jgi:NADH-quinone oxidoreductase subunit N
MLLMTYAKDLIIVFLALELLSIPLYVMAGFARLQVESEESALKYFLLGAFFQGLFSMGSHWFFGATGFTNFPDIVASVANKTVQMPLFLAGSALLLIGFSFKAAFVPFHMWTPDVYHGATNPRYCFHVCGS